LPTPFTGPLLGGNGDDGGEPALVPNLFYMHSFSDKWSAGIGITAPNGLATEYDSGWVGRYYGLRSELATLNINPSVAYKINDQWSLGVGVSFERAEAELTSAIDWGTGLAVAEVPGFTPQGFDGTVKIEGDDWGYGANIGLIFEPLAGTRLGLHYRSKIDHTLEGDATFNTPAAVLATGVPQSRGRIDTSASAEVSLPETVSLSAYHAFNDRWAILADATWTKWSRLEELRVKYGNGAEEENLGKGALIGEYDASIDIISAAVSFQF